jgi:hypothetical protein
MVIAAGSRSHNDKMRIRYKFGVFAEIPNLVPCNPNR